MRVLLGLLVSLSACGAPHVADATPVDSAAAADPGPSGDAPPGTRTLDRGRGTLVVFEREAGRYFDVHGYVLPDGYFTPSDAEVDAALAALGPSIAALPRAEGPADADAYYRHLVGVVREGRRQVFVFGFRAPMGSDWIAPLAVDDGGDRFFEGFYDLEAGAFRDLAFHGEA